MAQKYRKKPVIVYAEELLPTADAILKVEQFISGREDIIVGGRIAEDRFDEYVESIIKAGGRKMKTLESGDDSQFASMGDYIIRGVAGEFYPCKSEIFKATYEKVED